MQRTSSVTSFCPSFVQTVEALTKMMSVQQFTILLSKVQCDLAKRNTTFREAVTPKEKLAACLRFLATCDSLQTITFSYRLGLSTVQSIVLEICYAIIKELKSEVMGLPSKEDWERTAFHFGIFGIFQTGSAGRQACDYNCPSK